MKAVVALGANIGNPREQIELALTMLRAATEVTAVSSLHTTKPVGSRATRLHQCSLYSRK